MKLGAWIKENSIGRDIEITGITEDSREVQQGYVFAALRGSNADGEAFIADAVRRGASAVLVRQDFGPWPYDLALIRSGEPRKTLADIASAFYGSPSLALRAIGVTGTNGKTTTSYLIKQLLDAQAMSTGWVGTVGYAVGAEFLPATHTTPGAARLMQLLARMRDGGMKALSMEVSSHALDQRRADAIAWDVAVFTNWTRDHLDYHGTMQAYLESKLRLFELLNASPKEGRCAVINADDASYPRLRSVIRTRCLSYGLDGPADIAARNIALSAGGASFDLCTPWGNASVRLPLLGRFNVSNALAASAAAMALGMAPQAVAEGLARVQAPPGRMEFVRAGQAFEVVVDYAHTDDALANVLKTAREFTRGRLLLVFGCGGDRDRSKRPKMAAAAEAGADFSYVTSDNPRSEEPKTILMEIQRGFQRQDSFTLIEDRREAIARALGDAHPGDTVLIAGKGHERVQILKGGSIPFSDKDIAASWLSAYRQAAWNA